jgi:hypothetical protein
MFVPKREKVKEGAENYVKKNFTIYAILQMLLESGYINNYETDGICNTHAGE